MGLDNHPRYLIYRDHCRPGSDLLTGPAHLLAAVRTGEPLGPVVQHRMPSSQWRRYDKMRRLPDGLLACGDAICSFNPIYGQGMSVAALDAVALRDCLRRGVTDLPRRYFRATAKAIGVAWQTGATWPSPWRWCPLDRVTLRVQSGRWG
jgi:hypothetical protein